MTRAPSRLIGLAALGVFLVATTVGPTAAEEASAARVRSATQAKAAREVGRPELLDLYGDPLPPAAAVRLGTVRHRQETPIKTIAFASKGGFLVTDGEDPYLHVWDARDGKMVRRIEVGPGNLRVFSPSSDGKQVAVARYWLDAEEFRFKIDLFFFEPETGRRWARGPWEAEDNIGVLAFSPDTQLLAIGTTGGTVRLLDIRTGAEPARDFVGRRKILRLAFSPSGNRLAALSTEEGRFVGEDQLDVIDVRGRKKLRVFPELDNVENIAFSTDGNLIATAGIAGPQLWEVSSGRNMGTALIWGPSVAFSTDGRLLVGSNGQAFSFWDLAAERATDSFETAAPAGTAWALSPDGATIATNGGSTVLHSWDIGAHRDRLTEPAAAHQDRANALRFTADGKTLLSGSDDRTVRLWDVSNGRQKQVLGLSGKPRALALSPDGRLLLAGAQDHNWLFVWDLTAGDKPVILLDGYNPQAFPIAVELPNRNDTILTCWSDGKLRSWNWKDRQKKVVVQQLRILPMGTDHLILSEEDRFSSGVFFAAPRRIAVIESQNGLHVADLEAGKELYQVPDATVVTVSPDDRFLAIAQTVHDRRLRLFPLRHQAIKIDPQPSETLIILNSQTGKETHRIPIRSTEVWALRFSPDSKLLAATTGRDPGAIHLYEVANGREIRRIRTPMIGTPALAFAPDGSMLASGMADTSVLLWDLRPGP
jgi:WD40 repeat protein